VSFTFLFGSTMKTLRYGQRVVRVRVNHVVEVRDLAIGVADDRKVELRALVQLMSLFQRRWESTSSTDIGDQFGIALVELGRRAEKAPSSVVHTGVKSLGCEKRMPNRRPDSRKSDGAVGGLRREVRASSPSRIAMLCSLNVMSVP